MISKSFYENAANKGQTYGNAARQHYFLKDPSIVVSKNPYIVNYGDTLPDLARRIFGEENEAMWPIIADVNIPRHPDDWGVGDVLYLPAIVVNEGINLVRTIDDNAGSLTTTV